MRKAKSPPAEASIESKNFLTGFARGMMVLNAFRDQSHKMTLADMAKIVGLPRATTRRCLLTLQALGYATVDGRYFMLTPQVLTLSQAYLSSNPLARIAQSSLERASAVTGQSYSAGVLQNDGIIHIATTSKSTIANLQRGVGAQMPAYCSSVGRVLLASLPDAELNAYFKRVHLVPVTPYTIYNEPKLRQMLVQVRKDGYSYEDREMAVYARALAVPVYNLSGRLTASISIRVDPADVTKKSLLSEYLPGLLSVSAEIGALLAG